MMLHWTCSLYLSLLCVAGLGEFRIRDLNDHINKLLREKQHWQDRIVELGGTNYHVHTYTYLHLHWGSWEYGHLSGLTRHKTPVFV